MRGNAVTQFQKRFEPLVLGLSEIFHVVKTFTTAQQAADRNDQDVDQVVIFGPINPRITDGFELFEETQFRMRLHPTSSKHISQKYKCQNGTLAFFPALILRCVCPEFSNLRSSEVIRGSKNNSPAQNPVNQVNKR